MMRLIQNSWLVKLGAIIIYGGLAIISVGLGNDLIIPAASELHFVDARLTELRASPNADPASPFRKDTVVLNDGNGKELALSLNYQLAKNSGLSMLAGQSLRVGYHRADIYSVEFGGLRLIAYQSVSAVETAGNLMVTKIGVLIAAAGLFLTMVGIPFARRRITQRRGAVLAA